MKNNEIKINKYILIILIISLCIIRSISLLNNSNTVQSAFKTDFESKNQKHIHLLKKGTTLNSLNQIENKINLIKAFNDEHKYVEIYNKDYNSDIKIELQNNNINFSTIKKSIDIPIIDFEIINSKENINNLDPATISKIELAKINNSKVLFDNFKAKITIS